MGGVLIVARVIVALRGIVGGQGSVVQGCAVGGGGNRSWVWSWLSGQGEEEGGECEEVEGVHDDWIFAR